MFTVFNPSVNAQDDRVKVGTNDRIYQQGGYYNYGDPDKVNIELFVWGYVKNPGKYLVPKGTTLIDLISLAGGPTIEAELNNIRIYRPKNDSMNVKRDNITIYDYNDLVWEEKAKEKEYRLNPEMQPGDMLILPGSPRYFFRENLSFILSISSVLLSIAVLVVTLTK